MHKVIVRFGLFSLFVVFLLRFPYIITFGVTPECVPRIALKFDLTTLFETADLLGAANTPEECVHGLTLNDVDLAARRIRIHIWLSYALEVDTVYCKLVLQKFKQLRVSPNPFLLVSVSAPMLPGWPKIFQQVKRQYYISRRQALISQLNCMKHPELLAYPMYLEGCNSMVKVIQ